MFVSSNLLSDVLGYFKRKLKSIYDESEIETIFFLVCNDRFGLTKGQVLHTDKRLTESELLEFRDYVGRLANFEPVQYILGHTEFYGLKFDVSPAALIPRPETEELVDIILSENKSVPGLRILDVGCGSGCIAVTLKKNMPQASIYAVDLSQEALALAQKNAISHNVEVVFDQCDVLSDSFFELPGFDMVVSNPPYIAENEKTHMHANVLNFEPSQALFVPDHDPLKFYLRLLDFAKNKMHKGGMLYFELNPLYADDLKRKCDALNFGETKLMLDISAKKRFLKITL